MTVQFDDLKNSFDKDAVIAAVFESGVLGSSNHQIQLFEYLINAKHEGTINRVKAYNIAVDAFGRPQDFDGSLDSIVRVEMFRLRANLRTFNDQSDMYRLDLPKATYNISIREQKGAQKPSIEKIKAKPNSSFQSVCFKAFLALVPVILISAFFLSKPIFQDRDLANCSPILPNLSVNNVGSPSDSQIYVEQIIRSTIAQQTSFNVIDANQSCGITAAPLFKINYTLAHRNSSHIALAITAVSDQTGDIIISHNISGGSIEKGKENELYYELVKTANALSMPDSMITRAALISAWPNQKALNNYRCISLMYDSFSGGSEEEQAVVYECLKNSIKNGHASIDNYGALAAHYLEKARRENDINSKEMFDSAAILIDQVGESWINSAELTIAKIYYEVQRPDFDSERLDSLLIDAESKFSTNPQVLLTVAWRYGYSLGKWKEAKLISDQLKQIYSGRDQSMFIIDAGYALMNREGDELMKECSQTYTKNSAYISVIVHACALKAKDSDWLKATEENLQRLNLYNPEERMQVFNNTKYDFRFSGNVRKLLNSTEGI